MSAVVNPARGTVLSQGTLSGSTWSYTAVALITKLSGPKQKVGTRETTILTSTSKTIAATIPDLTDGVSGTLLLDPQSTTHLALQTLVNSPPLAPINWTIVFNDATNGPTTATFAGVLTEFSVGDIEVEGNLEADFTIAISGLITWTPAETLIASCQRHEPEARAADLSLASGSLEILDRLSPEHRTLSPMITRESFFAIPKLPTVPVEVPDVGTIHVKTMSAGERDEFESTHAKNPTKDFRARLVVATVVDDQGVKLFSPADVPAVSELPVHVLDPIIKAAAKANRMGEDDVETDRKKSDAEA